MSGNAAKVVTAEVGEIEDMVTRLVVLKVELVKVVVGFVVVFAVVTVVTVEYKAKVIIE